MKGNMYNRFANAVQPQMMHRCVVHGQMHPQMRLSPGGGHT